MSDWLRKVSPLLAILSVAIPIGLSVWVVAVKPEKAPAVMIPAAIYVGLVVMFESNFRGMNPRAAEGQRLLLRCCVFLGGALVMLLGPGTRLAILSSWLDAGALEATRQIAGVLSGAVFIVFGNFLPKLISPWRVAEEPFDWQGVHRFCSRVFMLAGGVIGWVWIAWPADDAATVTTIAVAVASVLCVTRKFYSIATWRGREERW